METISRYLLTFLLNALWQVPLVTAVAALASRFLRQAPARHAHAVWVAALAVAAMLPLVSARTSDSSPTPKFTADLTVPGAVAAKPPSLGVAVPALRVPQLRTVSLPVLAAAALVWAYLLFVLFRLLRLAWRSVSTVRIRRSAYAAPLTERLQAVRDRCHRAFGGRAVKLLCSSQISGPVTAGSAILVPESLLGETSEELLTTAIGHEMAHVARHDFTWNLFAELLYLPVSFHPAAWLLHRGIERTREMACDELVTQRLLDAGAYARSLLTIARSMTALPRAGYSLGVFDGDILEERIRQLARRPAANPPRARLLLASGLAALAICAVVASSLALTARAQGAVDSLINQGLAAQQRGDYPAAAREFAAAVQLDSANLKVKLLLANALLSQYVPEPHAATNPLVTGAQKQFLDVLARDPRNPAALQGMLSLYVNTRQYAEALEWARKAIAADANDKFAYYTAGFVDWQISFPVYASARQEAGMRPDDPGVIPNITLRQSTRAVVMPLVEDGLRMLQTALQLDPDYADAMAYMNLLYRIESGLVDTDAESADLVRQGDEWVVKALQSKRKVASNAILPGALPPPPPPPLPPPAVQGTALPKLVKQTPLLIPPQLTQSGVKDVQLSVVVAKDGTVKDVTLLNGDPELAGPIVESVRQWEYEPTMINGQPAEVTTSLVLKIGRPPQ